MLPLAIIILILVLLGICCREMLPINIPIWAYMLCGALAVLIFQSISIAAAWQSIKFEVILYLFGVFVIAEGMEQSGYLESLTHRVFNHTESGTHLLVLMTLLAGLSSALLMNDTIAIIGTPVILQLTQRHPEMKSPLLLALAYSVTIGSVMTPIGNPQNLLIAIESGMSSPFLSFFKVLFLPTLINLVVMLVIMATLYRKTLSAAVTHSLPRPISDQRTARLSQLSFFMMLGLVIIKIGLRVFHAPYHLNFSLITLIACLPIILGSRQRSSVLKQLDWGTLIFFVAMFILMDSVWESGFFQSWINDSPSMIKNKAQILGVSVLLSQLISNVPLVALYLPLLKHVGAVLAHYLALAVGSTLAGNIFVFGAASNIIIIQNAEKRGEKAFNYWVFSGVGIIITLINLLIYYVFLN